jgi:TrpR-related protein YerC/YecD
MHDRLDVAKLLLEGETYEVIGKKTKMSSATISRVNRCIQYGSGGYRRILNKIK